MENENNTWASIGIHPHEAKIFANDKEKKQQFAELIKRDKVIAIGECGLDYYYNHSDKEDQLELLRYQIELATLNKLPIVFHVRDAFTDFWPMFNTFSGVRGVLHSFTDSIENLNIAVSKNLMIGVNGIATFAKQAEQISMYKTIPLENLVLETDAPYLTPIPHRGSINEPKYIKDIAVFMAKLKETTIEEVAKHTTRNAMKLFGMN